MIAFLLFILLQVADGWTTITALNLNGREANPMLNYLFRRFGVVQTLMVVKGGSIIIAGLFLVGHWSLWCLVGLYVLVVGHNVYQIRKA
jgi:hypothetical protein